MNSNINKSMLATFFVVAGAIGSAALTLTAAGTSTVTPAFAQGDNMTGGGNATEGNMTGSDMAESGSTGTDMSGLPVIPP